MRAAVGATKPGPAGPPGPAGRLLAVNFAALAILGAAFNGVSFLNYGHAFSSMIMAGLWALALACYITGVYLAARRISRP